MIAAAGGKVVRGGAESGAENGAGLLTVTGLEAPRIGELAASASIVLHELTPLASLEGAFMELTSGSVEFGASGRPGRAGHHQRVLDRGDPRLAAGRAAPITHTHETADDLLSPWQGFGVLCIWTVLALAVAAYLLEHRHA